MARPFILTPDAFTRKTGAQLRGQKAQRAGSNFQKVINTSAGIHSNHVNLEGLPSFGAKYVGFPRQLVTTPICCDYVGGIVDGPGLFFDAKSCGEDSVSFNVKTMIMTKPHQLNFLRRMKAARQVAGYLVECKQQGQYLWLDVKHVTDDLPIRFARDGALCRQWFELGSTALLVRFDLLKEAYGHV